MLAAVYRPGLFPNGTIAAADAGARYVRARGPAPRPPLPLPPPRPPPPAPYSWPSDASTATAAAAVFHSPQPATASSPCHRPPPHAAPARRRHARGGSSRPERAAGARGRRSGSQRRGSCERPPPGGRRAVPPVSCHRGRGRGAGPGIVSQERPTGPAVRGAGPARTAQEGDGLGSPGSRPESAAVRASWPGAPGCHPNSPGGEPRCLAWAGRAGGVGCVPRPGGAPTGRLTAGSLVAGTGARCPGASPVVRGRAPDRSSGWRPHFAGRRRGGRQRLSFLYYLLTVFASGPTKAAGPELGQGRLSDGGLRRTTLEPRCASLGASWSSRVSSGL